MQSDLTLSLCPECLERIPARRIQRGDATYLLKTCSVHGTFETVLWKGAPPFHDWNRPKRPTGLSSPSSTVPGRGCPFECGLCLEHRQRSCTVLVEVTQRCNLQCPVCYADAGISETDDIPDDIPVDRLVASIHRIRQKAGNCHIQLSGGEPTIRDDLPEIVSGCRAAGFSFVQINTNGIRLGESPAYARELKEAGAASVFLQFDGTHDSIYQHLRGQALLKKKMAAIEACADAGIGVVLVATLVPGVNTDNVGEILKLGMAHAPAVRGVHFQPISYFGRYEGSPADTDRLTLPQLMQQLERQGGGKFRASHLAPPGCENPKCSFHGNFVITENGALVPLSEGGCCGDPETAETGAKKAISFVARQWAAPLAAPASNEMAPAAAIQADAPGDDWSLDAFVHRASTHTFSVSAMAFMDAWTLDLERLRDCCIHVATPDEKLIPFCAYNLTGNGGKRLYRGCPKVSKTGQENQP